MKKQPKPPKATDGGSLVALSARFRPGGLHGRRKIQRRVERERSIRESGG